MDDHHFSYIKNKNNIFKITFEFLFFKFKTAAPGPSILGLDWYL
jgi:hypothetical protein